MKAHAASRGKKKGRTEIENEYKKEGTDKRGNERREWRS